MFNQDKLCSMCQAGVEHDCGPKDDLHPDDKARCTDCGDVFNRRSARLGADRCPSCERRDPNTSGW